MGEIAARQAILHGVIAAAFVEAVLLAWKVRAPAWRLAFWLLALACPFVLLPFFLVVAPFRAEDAFTAGRALFSSRRWADVQVGGIAVDALVFGALAACGVLLFLRDAVPMVASVWRERRTEEVRRPVHEHVKALVAASARSSGVDVPAVVALPSDPPVFFVRGLRRHTLVYSEGALARLSGEEFAAALAHELAHVRARDPLAGWLLMAARALMFWNPAVQVVGRAIVQEMEHRADAEAMRTAGAASFVSALRTLVERPEGRDGRSMAARLAGHAHRAQLHRRLDWLFGPATELRFPRSRLAVVAATLGVLLFFVV